MAQYEYTLGAAGERTKVKELDRTVEYTYDALYRLTGEKITAADKTVTEYTYAYDKVSNRILKTENGTKTTYTYNALNQLVKENDTVYKYDDAGNLISTTSSDKSAAYTYNAENKLICATVNEAGKTVVEEYTYDYAGNRTSKTTGSETVKYLNDNSVLTNVIAELDVDDNELCYYTIGADLISQERNGKTSLYLYDGHGSVRGLIDENSKVTDTYNYDAFGNLLDKTGTTVNNYLYCGEQFDSATGLYYLRARYMNPATGTFITQDTYSGTIFDPTSLHKYLYANANPVKYTDPSGYSPNASLVEQNAVVSIMGTLREMAESAASFAVKYYLKFRVSMPMITAAATGMATFMSNSPVFMNICARFASGDLSPSELLDEILTTFDNINPAVWDQFYETTGRSVGSSNSGGGSSSGSGASGNFDPNDPEFIRKIKDAISNVSNQCKGYGNCDKFKDAFARELDKRGINYEIIRVESNYPKAAIVSNKYNYSAIGDTGFHYGVKVGDIVYDNLTTEGMNFVEWINDLGGFQYIHLV